jgi:hypothetical protein
MWLNIFLYKVKLEKAFALFLIIYYIDLLLCKCDSTYSRRLRDILRQPTYLNKIGTANAKALINESSNRPTKASKSYNNDSRVHARSNGNIFHISDIYESIKSYKVDHSFWLLTRHSKRSDQKEKQSIEIFILRNDYIRYLLSGKQDFVLFDEFIYSYSTFKRFLIAAKANNSHKRASYSHNLGKNSLKFEFLNLRRDPVFFDDILVAHSSQHEETFFFYSKAPKQRILFKLTFRRYLLTLKESSFQPFFDKLCSYICRSIARKNSANKSRNCIDSSQVCDGRVDCVGGVDESNCDYSFRPSSRTIRVIREDDPPKQSRAKLNELEKEKCLKQGHFWCPSDTKCVNYADLCNDVENCSDKLDELNLVCLEILSNESAHTNRNELLLSFGNNLLDYYYYFNIGELHYSSFDFDELYKMRNVGKYLSKFAKLELNSPPIHIDKNSFILSPLFEFKGERDYLILNGYLIKVVSFLSRKNFVLLNDENYKIVDFSFNISHEIGSYASENEMSEESNGLNKFVQLEQIINVNSSGLVEVVNLVPGAEYFCYFYVNLSISGSIPVELSNKFKNQLFIFEKRFVIKTNEDQPSEPLSLSYFVEKHDLSFNNQARLYLRWLEPNEPNGIIDEYYLHVHPPSYKHSMLANHLKLNASSNTTDTYMNNFYYIIKSSCSTSGAYSVSFDLVESDIVYSFWVEAVNSLYKSARSNLIEFSLSDANNPVFLTSNRVDYIEYDLLPDQTDVSLRWSKISSASFYIVYIVKTDASMLSYNNYMAVNTRLNELTIEMSSTWTRAINTTNNAVRLDGLAPLANNYSIIIHAGNSNGVGPPSAPYRLGANELRGVKWFEQKPLLIDVQMVSESAKGKTVNITWSYKFKPYLDSLLKLRMTKFFIYYGLNNYDLSQNGIRKMLAFDLIFDTHETVVRSFSEIVDDLLSCEHYIVRIQAVHIYASIQSGRLLNAYSSMSVPAYFTTYYSQNAASKLLKIRLINYTALQLIWRLKCMLPASRTSASPWLRNPDRISESKYKKFSNSTKYLVYVYNLTELSLPTSEPLQIIQTTLVPSNIREASVDIYRLRPGASYLFVLAELDVSKLNDSTLNNYQMKIAMKTNLTIANTRVTVAFNLTSYPKVTGFTGKVESGYFVLTWDYPIGFSENSPIGFVLYKSNSDDSGEMIRIGDHLLENTFSDLLSTQDLEHPNKILNREVYFIAIKDKYNYIGPLSDPISPYPWPKQPVVQIDYRWPATITYFILILLVVVLLSILIMKYRKKLKNNFSCFITTHYNRVLDRATFLRASPHQVNHSRSAGIGDTSGLLLGNSYGLQRNIIYRSNLDDNLYQSSGFGTSDDCQPLVIV